jgi:MOSC domain-containing protein YiiM
MSTGSVLSITVKPRNGENRPGRFSRVPAEQAKLVAKHGIDGDAKAGRSHRQLNVMFADMVAQLLAEGFYTAPGELGEQLVIADIPSASVRKGTRLRLGDAAIVELVSLREPCGRFTGIQGKPVALAVERIGYMANVLVGGDIAVGSAVTVE